MKPLTTSQHKWLKRVYERYVLAEIANKLAVRPGGGIPAPAFHEASKRLRHLKTALENIAGPYDPENPMPEDVVTLARTWLAMTPTRPHHMVGL